MFGYKKITITFPLSFVRVTTSYILNLIIFLKLTKYLDVKSCFTFCLITEQKILWTRKRWGKNVLCVNQWFVLNCKSDWNISDGLFNCEDFFLVGHIFVDDTHQVFFIWSGGSWKLKLKNPWNSDLIIEQKKTHCDIINALAQSCPF